MVCCASKGEAHLRFLHTPTQCRVFTLRRCLTTTGSDTTMNALGPKASLYTPPLSRNLQQARALVFEHKNLLSHAQGLQEGKLGVRACHYVCSTCRLLRPARNKTLQRFDFFHFSNYLESFLSLPLPFLYCFALSRHVQSCLHAMCMQAGQWGR